MQYIQTGENDLLKRRVYLHLVDGTDGITAKTAQTGTCKVSINGGAPTTSRNSIVEIDSTNLPGDYYLTLDVTELISTGIVMVRFKNGSTAEFVQLVQVMAFDPYTQFGNLGGGGVSGPDIDYKRIARIVADNMNLMPLPKEPERVDLTPLQAQLFKLQETVNAIDIPEVKLDLTAVSDGIQRVEVALKGLNFPSTDIQPILDRLETLGDLKVPQLEASAQQATEIATEVKDLLAKLRTFFGDDIDQIKLSLEELTNAFESSPRLVIQGGTKGQQQ